MDTIIQTEETGLRIEPASPSDGPALQALQRRCTHRASFDVEKFNFPDFFGRARVYETSRVFTARLGDALVGSIAAGVRELSLNGKRQRVGYIFQMFVAPEAQGRGLARLLYQRDIAFFKEQGCSAAYMIVAEGNQACERVIEKEGAYRARPLTMASLPVYRQMRLREGVSIRPFTPEDAEAVAALSNRTWEGHQMYEPQSKERLLRELARVPGFGPDSLLVLEENGTVRACAGFWDASQIERVIMRSLSLRLRATAFALDLARVVREAPRVPRPGETLTQWLLAPIGWERIEQLNALFAALNNRAKKEQIGQLFLLCEAKHPILDALAGFFRVDVGLHLFVHPLAPNTRLESGPLYVAPTDQ
jgi:predicted N-acetyltransferase YhbS